MANSGLCNRLEEVLQRGWARVRHIIEKRLSAIMRTSSRHGVSFDARHRRQGYAARLPIPIRDKS